MRGKSILGLCNFYPMILKAVLFFTVMITYSWPLISYSEDVDVTSSVQRISSRLMFDRSTNTSYLDLSLKNISQGQIQTPVQVIIKNISDSRVTVDKSDGITTDGNPYFSYSQAIPGDVLLPGVQSLSRRIIFKNPNRLTFTYQSSVVVQAPPKLPVATPVISKVISAAQGGTIIINDTRFVANGFEMVIPAGALNSDTEIQISEYAINQGTNIGRQVGLNLPLMFQPSGLKFLKPVTIKIPYLENSLFTSGNVDLTYASLWMYSDITKSWEHIAIKSVDTVNKRIVAEITHFSDCWIMSTMSGKFQQLLMK